MRLGQTLLAGALAAATVTGTADVGIARESASRGQVGAHQSQGIFHLHSYPPVRVTVQPSRAHPRSNIRVSFHAPFDLQPGDIWTATFTTCAQTTRDRFKGFTKRAQFVNQKAFSGGEAAGSKASVTLKPSDIDFGPKKGRWCKGTAVLSIFEANPSVQENVPGIGTQAQLVEILELRGGITTPSYKDVMKPVPVKP